MAKTVKAAADNIFIFIGVVRTNVGKKPNSMTKKPISHSAEKLEMEP